MTEPEDRCPLCGGEWIDGRLAVPVVGSLRFSYRLGTNDVTPEVAAPMCADCGHVGLRARDPEMIVRARRAAERGRVGTRWVIGSRRGQGG